MKKLLPIGSIVRLEDNFKSKLLIIGRGVKNKNEDYKIWDYVGCPVPAGIQSDTSLVFFDQNQIKQIVFIGLQDEEEIAYSFMLSKKLKELNKWFIGYLAFSVGGRKN